MTEETIIATENLTSVAVWAELLKLRRSKVTWVIFGCGERWHLLRGGGWRIKVSDFFLPSSHAVL